MPQPPYLIVTTAVKGTADLEERARLYAAELNVPFQPRRRATIPEFFSETNAQRILMVGTGRSVLHDQASGAQYFFHPNMITVRGFNIISGSRDLFAEATGLQPGDSILDCTLGFAGEATLASYLTQETGSVVGLESAPELALVTREGLAQFHLPIRELREAMRRVQVIAADYCAFLPTCRDKSFDVVYFDPFFEQRLSGSEQTVTPLTIFGNLTPLHGPSVLAARRVARRRVVIKHPFVERLPAEISEHVSYVVSARRSRLVYSVIETVENTAGTKRQDGE